MWLLYLQNFITEYEEIHEKKRPLCRDCQEGEDMIRKVYSHHECRVCPTQSYCSNPGTLNKDLKCFNFDMNGWVQSIIFRPAHRKKQHTESKTTDDDTIWEDMHMEESDEELCRV